MELVYDERWVTAPESRPLSLSLPINLDGQSLKGDRVGFFFDNLLPDSEPIRRRIQSRFRTNRADAFDLLEAIGRDCVGAVQLLPDGEDPEGVFEIDARPVDESKIEELLRGLVAEPTGLASEETEFRISIAGAQEKTALTRHRGRWCMPRGSTPTTHIFKLPLGIVGGRKLDLSTSLENEWLCSRILREYGLPVASCELAEFGSAKALVVARFDRQLHTSKKYWLRLPQEDFCQATGTPSVSKYESDGGPGLVSIARVLQGSDARDEDIGTLLRAQLLFWMLAATDGHAKNFSLRLLAGGRYRLTPLYDVISAWPITGSRGDQVHMKKLRLAMAVLGDNKHYRVSEIQRRHFNITAQRCGFGPNMEDIIDEVLAKTPAVVDSVGRTLPRRFPAKIFDAIVLGLTRSARQLESMPASA
jgi:serine/threonine-protein kinase HipA